MANHINHILVAEFDIDKGSQLTHQYPEKTGIEEHKLAELMLPDGAHLREEDWTSFVLNQHIVEDSTSSYSEQQENFISEGFQKFQPVIPTNCYTYADGIWNKIVEYDEIFIQLLQDKILLINKTLKLIGELTPESIIDSLEDINSLSVKIATKSKIYGFKFLSEDDFRLALITLRSLLYQRSTTIKPDHIEIPDKPLPIINNETNLLYVLNLVRTKQIPGVRRGARVKAIAITSHHKWLHVFKPLLIMALDSYFEKQEISILEKLYKSMNCLDISLMPLLSYNEKIILRASDDPMLFNESFLEMEDFVISMNKYNNKLGNNQIKKIDRHFYETNVLYDIGAKNPIKVPIKIPMTMFNGEIGDLSVIQLISTFGNSAYPTKHHPYLDNNMSTNPIIILINALLTQKRILFLGHQKPSGEVANFVLAACALGSCGILRGYTERCFPYTNLAGLDDLLKVPGFIAGVTNPAFEEHPQWWDVLFNINTGKVTISPNIEKAPPLPNNIFTTGEKDATVISSFDKEFMNDIMSLIQQKYGEHYIRERFRLYLLRFIEVAAEYEKTVYGNTKIGYTPENIDDKYNLGVGAFFVDELSKRKEIVYNVNRIEGWRRTKSYELYKKDFHQSLLRKSVRCVDIRRQANILRTVPSINPERLNTILKAFAENITTDEQVLELLIHFLHNQGGLFPIASSLLHSLESIRINCTKILVRLDYSPIGSRILSHLNPFFKLAYEKSAQKFEKRWGRNWFIIGNDSTYPKELLQNQAGNNANENPITSSANSININGSNNMNSNPNINSNSNRNSGIYSSSNSIFSPERRRSFNTINDDVSSIAVDPSKQFPVSPRLNQRKPSNPLSAKLCSDSYSLPVPPRQVDNNNALKIKVKTKNVDHDTYPQKKSNLSSPDSIQSPYSISSPTTIGKAKLKREKSSGASSINRSRSNSNKNISKSKSSTSISKSSSTSRSRSRSSSRSQSQSRSDSRSRSRSNSQTKSYDHDILSSTSESDIESDFISKDDIDDEEVLKNINQHIQGNDVPYCDILEDDLINLYNANSSKEVSEDSRNFGDISMNLHKLKVNTSGIQDYDQSLDQSRSMNSSQPDLDDNQLFSSRLKSPGGLDTSFMNNSFVKQAIDTSLISNTNKSTKPNNGLIFNQRSDSFNHPYGDSEDLSKNILFSNHKKDYKNTKKILNDSIIDDDEYVEGYSRAYSNSKYSNSRGTIENSYLDETYSSFASTSLSLSTASSFSTPAKGKDSGKEPDNSDKLGVHHFGQYGNESGVQSNAGELSNSHLIPDYETKVENEQLVIPKIDVAPAKSSNPVIQKILQKQQLSINKFNNQ